ncbi:hypothetical protein QU481_11990 [Crenobacter sp. SG2303]|uniref:Uncharacterized protein n=1 Tax=Crenobacter oryzisoli TaxID=3056844 RepID=A0ABT7XP89_9NEIS|nr:hypothetical protein [Crenobacter sp. SG2303]MDN0075613.1 hypothetical protein [Crenobacter sp. SG2303]
MSNPANIKLNVLNDLSFGFVDAESEEDLNIKFLKTTDFEEFLKPEISLVLGSKGAGKSALFKLLTKFDFIARKLANGALNEVTIVEATGFNDVSEIDTESILELQKNPDFDYAKLWRLYFAVKLAKKLAAQGVKTKGAAAILLKDLKAEKDFRLLPLLTSVWEKIIGRAPKKVTFPIFGELQIGSKTVDVSAAEVLTELNSELASRNQKAWLVFDRIDELFAGRPEERKRAISSLLVECKNCQDKYSHIRFKVLLRTDIWAQLEFINKTHYSDKTIKIAWSENDLAAMLVKRVLANANVRGYFADLLGSFVRKDVEGMSEAEVDEIFYSIFEGQIYKGPKEAKTLSWMIERSTDGTGCVYPRELIMYAQISKQKQSSSGPGGGALIEGASIRDAYYEVSEARCNNYLAEFPWYSQHFKKFSGATKTEFSRDELLAMFDGLGLEAEEAIKDLATNVGVLKPVRGSVHTAETFQIPKLYVYGLGITIRGRP